MRAVFLGAMVSLLPASAWAAVERVVERAGGFPMVRDGVAAPIVVAADVPTVVRLAAEDLAEDVERVTGVRPGLVSRRPDDGTPVVELRLAADARGHWETFRLSATDDTLVVHGTDARGLAFGIYELSKRIGVSPWHWWADVPVARHEDLRLSLGTGPTESPGVKYRGIFINDEDWGLEPWARLTYEPEVGNLGPKTYSRIFELMLRLRANTLWPAMHPCTTPFHQVPGNAQAADDHAIILGSSHAEPMLRNNVGEWRKPHREFDFLSHRGTVLDYWEERVRQRVRGESIFTLGMRGIHDSPIQGPKSQRERIATLEDIFAAQRGLLARHLGRGDAAGVAQMFCPYKEVLVDYLAGLKVPADVTLVWPDDNFGYVRRFATEAERDRTGGLGVYYHLSYLGAPLAWLWFDSLPPALVWSEMTRAYEQGAQTLWIANVGDIKGNEQSMAYFLDLAWHAGRTTPDHPARFLGKFAEENFGPEHAGEIADLWRRHQALAFARKPEHLQWHLPKTPYAPTSLTGKEITARLEAYAGLEREARALAANLPAEMQDAFFQLVGYPIAAAAASNERYFRAELARLQLARGDESGARATSAASAQAEQAVQELNRRYNEETAGGKWRHVMTALGVSPREWRSFQPAPLPPPGPGIAEIAPEPAAVVAPVVVPAGARQGDFVERDGVISIVAGHFTERHDLRDGAGWRAVPGLGRTGAAVTVLPSTASVTSHDAPRLGYRIHVASGGRANVHVRLLPTHPLVAGRGLRFALAVDGGEPIPLAVKTGFDPATDAWKWRVLANATEATARLTLTPGWHTLHLVAVDAGVVVDKLVLDFGGLRPSYDGPAETRVE